MLTEWTSPGKGASVGAVKALVHGFTSKAMDEWKTRTSLYVDFQALLDGCRPDEQDVKRFQEVLRRLKAGEEL